MIKQHFGPGSSLNFLSATPTSLKKSGDFLFSKGFSSTPGLIADSEECKELEEDEEQTVSGNQTGKPLMDEALFR